MPSMLIFSRWLRCEIRAGAQSSQIKGLRCMRIILRDMSKCLYCSNILFIVQGISHSGKENMMDFGQKGKKKRALLSVRPKCALRRDRAFQPAPCDPLAPRGPFGSWVLAPCGSCDPCGGLRPALTGCAFSPRTLPALCGATFVSPRLRADIDEYTVDEINLQYFFRKFLKIFCNFLLNIIYIV